MTTMTQLFKMVTSNDYEGLQKVIQSKSKTHFLTPQIVFFFSRSVCLRKKRKSKNDSTLRFIYSRNNNHRGSN